MTAQQKVVLYQPKNRCKRMKRFELSTLSLARRCSTTELHPQVVTSALLIDQKIMHYGGAAGQFPRQTSDDARAERPTDALDARRQFSDPGTQPRP